MTRDLASPPPATSDVAVSGATEVGVTEDVGLVAVAEVSAVESSLLPLLHAVANRVSASKSGMVRRMIPPYRVTTIRSSQHCDPSWQTMADTMTVVGIRQRRSHRDTDRISV